MVLILVFVLKYQVFRYSIDIINEILTFKALGLVLTSIWPFQVFGSDVILIVHYTEIKLLKCISLPFIYLQGKSLFLSRDGPFHAHGSTIIS